MTAPLDTKPTSVLLFAGANEALDQIAARLTLATNRRHTRADAHRFVLSIGIDAVNRAASLAENSSVPTVYVASKTRHAAKWRALRDCGIHVISTWIDESGIGETSDWSDLWKRCVYEAATADVCLVYCEPGDVLKGALVEMGAALASGKTVIWVGPRDVLTAVRHPFVRFANSVADALEMVGLSMAPCPTLSSAATGADGDK